MRLLILLTLLVSGANAAAPVVASAYVTEIGYNEAKLTVFVNAQIADPHFTVWWGYTDATASVASLEYGFGCNWVDIDGDSSGDRTECSVQILRIEPDRDIYARVILLDGALQTDWKCVAGSINMGTISGMTCGASDNYPHFHTAKVPGPPEVPYPNGTAPQATVPPVYTPPVITGVEGTNQFTAANDCSDLMTVQFPAAIAAAATKDVQIILNPGSANACAPFTMPNYTGSHKILIRSSAADYLLPPPGGRPEPRHFPYMAYVNKISEGAAMVGNANTNHYYFLGIFFTQYALYPTADIPALVINRSEPGTSGIGGVSGKSSTWRFTTSTSLPAHLSAGSKVAIEGVATLNAACRPGPVEVNLVLSTTSFQIYCAGEEVVPATVDTTTANRFLVPVGSQRIEDVSFTGCTGGNARARLASGSRWGGLAANTVVHIMGTGTGMDHGLTEHGWRLTSVSGRDACLVNSSGLVGSYNANTAVYALDTKTTNVVDISGATDVWFDRCVFDGGEWPNRTLQVVVMSACNDCGLINSRIDNVGGWLAIDPGTGSWIVYATPQPSTAGYAVEWTYAQNLLVENNFMRGTGIMMFSQNGTVAGLPIANNVTIRRNQFEIPTERMASGPGSNGAYYAHRHWLECKGCTNVEFSGNYGCGGYVEEVSVGSAIALTTRQKTYPPYANGVTDPGGIRDVLIKDNYFCNFGGLISTSYDSDSNRNGTFPTVRIEISNNILDNMDWYSYRSDPTVNGAGKQVSVTSGSFAHTAHTTGFIADHNTIIRQTGQGPSLVEISGFTHLHGHQVYTNNIWQDNRTPNTSGIQMGAFFGTDWQGNWKDTFLHGVPFGVYAYPSQSLVADPYSRWAGNLIVPGSQNNDQYVIWDTSCYTSTSAACNITNAERNTFWGTGTGTNYDANAAYTFTGTTPNARLSEVGFYNFARGDYRVSDSGPAGAATFTTTDGKAAGADLEKINIARRWIQNLRATSIGVTTAVVALTSPVAGEACYVTCPTCSTKRYSDTASTRPRTFSMTGLTTETNYTVWATCGSNEQYFTFRTQ